MYIQSKHVCTAIIFGCVLMNLSFYGLIASSHRDLRRKCINSGLWDYTFVNTLFVVLYIFSKNKVPLENMYSFTMSNIVLLIYLMIIVLWGVYELVNPCSVKYLSDGIIYKIGIGWVLLYTYTSILVLLGLVRTNHLIV